MFDSPSYQTYAAPKAEPPSAMTLRDWYIGQALVGILAHQGLRGNPELQAQNACDLANLVMQAREEQAREEEP